MQQELIKRKKQEIVKLTKKYDTGFRNDIYENEQHIRITEGCPNKCPYCAESFENGTEPVYFGVPEIVRNQVKLYDMNLISKPRALEIIKELGSRKVNGRVVYYELWCGVDFRYMTQEIAIALKKNRFINIRLAWDWGFSKQKKIRSVIKMLTKAGYRSEDIMVFMICNWKIPYLENLRKLDLCKVWNVLVDDCYFDNQLAPNIKPIHWTIEQIKDFRARARKHNQLVNFKIDPEEK